MSDQLRLTIVHEDAGDGWVVARIPQVPGVITQAATRGEARENVIDTLKVMVEGDDESLEADESADTETITLTVGS